MTKTRGARAALDRLYGVLDELDALAEQARELVVFDPQCARSQLLTIGDRGAQLRHLLRTELEPLLERREQRVATDALPAAVAQLQAEFDALRAELAELKGQPKITPFRRTSE